MSQEKPSEYSAKKKAATATSPRELLYKYLPYLPWILVSMLLFLLAAHLKLRYQPNIYSISGTVMVKDPTRSSQTEKVEELLIMPSQNKSISDEIQVVSSLKIRKMVVRSLGLTLMYSQRGKVRGTLVRAAECPFNLIILNLKDSSRSFVLPVRITDDNGFSIGSSEKYIPFNQPIENDYGRFIVKRMPISLGSLKSKDYTVDYMPEYQRADQLAGAFSASPSGESTTIMKMVFESENPVFGMEVINQWMQEYEKAGLEENKLSSDNTLRFINEQLENVNSDLGSVERNLLGFRERNRVINPDLQSEQFISNLSEIDKEYTRQNLQLKLVENLIDYISDNRNPYRQVGSILSIDEPTLALQLGEFNKLQVERETLLKTTARLNPMVVGIETAIEKLRLDIIQNLQNVRQAYRLALGGLSVKNRAANREISSLPVKEKQLLDITRRQKILETLYSFLLEKKFETSIGSASTLSNVRVIEPAKASYSPVRPNRKGTYLAALLLGFAIPSAVMFLVFEYFNDKVTSRSDITRMTDTPIIGEVSHSEERSSMVVGRTSRKFIAEQFRIIRTNMQYVLPSQEKAVIIVTSSTSGEGKSFISTNMGAVMALAGKKTAILEFDIRKPKILSGLKMEKKPGISNYILGGIGFEELPVPIPGVENLYVIPCGPIPPNPSEFLLDPRMEAFMKKVIDHFDVLIIDTAPVGLVSDAIVLGRYADACLYVVRHGYTFKKQLQMLDEYYTQKRLPRMSLVLNDIKLQAGYGRYYGYGGYGYGGYGYGYGSEYFDAEKNRRRGIRNWLSRIFRFS